ncbi:MAG TPA: hypothetical protein VLV16_12145 [Gemmatimonadales bacterium]|nr:hypothetical protein [Gemmatimonadales bacterium]
MSGERRLRDALVAAGAVPASHVPEESTGRGDLLEVAGAELVEDATVTAHPVAPIAGPPAVAFLDGIERWLVTFYDGVVPIVRAYVAGAVRRRDGSRRLSTALAATREFHVAPLAALRPGVRAALEASEIELVDVAADAQQATQPGRALEAARRVVENARVALEKALGERHAAALGPDEWLVVDGVLSESAALSRHPRALGVIKSHAAQYFEGEALTRALTIPDHHRSSVFQPRGRARHEVYSWYLRLWPWEGNDLLFGLVRVEARAHADTVATASRIAGWLVRERAPVATPDRRWDRLLYPMHDVETYLRARAPRELVPRAASRLPRRAS